jgi:acyl-CoA synthetase (AMP-forming)/AMP-acid ligase II
MMLEYYNNPAGTVDAWRNGWFHAGDLGYLDEAGYLFYVDRKKDAMRRRGEMVSSWDVETVSGSHFQQRRLRGVLPGSRVEKYKLRVEGVTEDTFDAMAST